MERGILGNAIRTARLNQHITQEELAERLKISPIHIKHIESEHRKPSVPLLFQLIELLNISLDHLLFPDRPQEDVLYHHVTQLLRQCDDRQLMVINATVEAFLKQTK